MEPPSEIIPRAGLVPGEIFAREFRVVRPLAAGGMGAVYIVEQVTTGRERALKLLHPDLAVDPKARARFEDEARVGARVRSEHVVEVVDAGIEQESGTPWIAMELLDGQDLSDWATERLPLDRETIVFLFGQLCHAVGAAHRAGIVHRDLKPENVFVAKSRRNDVEHTVKVLDFGIAKWLGEVTVSSRATQSVGTPLWMSPEQAQLGESVGPETDVWALGLMAYWALTGRFYWRAANTADAGMVQLLVELTISDLDLASVRAREQGVSHLLPPGFDEIFARCVTRDRSARYPDASAMWEALARLLTSPGRSHATEPAATSSAAPLPSPSTAVPAAHPAATSAWAPTADAFAPATGGEAPEDRTDEVTLDGGGSERSTTGPVRQGRGVPSRRLGLAVVALTGLALFGIAGIGLAFSRATPDLPSTAPMGLAPEETLAGAGRAEAPEPEARGEPAIEASDEPVDEVHPASEADGVESEPDSEPVDDRPRPRARPERTPPAPALRPAPVAPPPATVTDPTPHRTLRIRNERPVTLSVRLECAGESLQASVPARGEARVQIPAGTACDTRCSDPGGTVICNRISETRTTLRVR